MNLRYEPAGKADCYFAKDGSGVVMYCEVSGDTHFLHVNPHAIKQLLAQPHFCLEELREALSLDVDDASELANNLVGLGLIDEID